MNSVITNQDLSHRIDKLENKIQDIENKLDLILKILHQEVKPNCQKMSEHINFVDGVYTQVKKPMQYVCSFFTEGSKKNQPMELPDLSHNTKN